jgi:hypothetical protein
MVRKGQACGIAPAARVGLLHGFVVGMFGIEVLSHPTAFDSKVATLPLKRPETESVSKSIKPAYQIASPKLQHFPLVHQGYLLATSLFHLLRSVDRCP